VFCVIIIVERREYSAISPRSLLGGSHAYHG
jgi:hypothetical protein